MNGSVFTKLFFWGVVRKLQNPPFPRQSLPRAPRRFDPALQCGPLMVASSLCALGKGEVRILLYVGESIGSRISCGFLFGGKKQTKLDMNSLSISCTAQTYVSKRPGMHLIMCIAMISLFICIPRSTSGRIVINSCLFTSECLIFRIIFTFELNFILIFIAFVFHSPSTLCITKCRRVCFLR